MNLLKKFQKNKLKFTWQTQRNKGRNLISGIPNASERSNKKAQIDKTGSYHFIIFVNYT